MVRFASMVRIAAKKTSLKRTGAPSLRNGADINLEMAAKAISCC